ncbi:MAG: response regulator transcription factor [Rubrivivax sp.]|nr:MAG: response regulator transcription factor [Rubrivivax sp.]
MNRIRIVLVDDHAVVRMGFKLLLESTQQMQVIGESDCGEDAYERHLQRLPDITILDLTMPGMGGLETLRRLRSIDPKASVLVLSAHEDTCHVRKALKAGASGYFSKRAAPEGLIDAVHQIMSGQIALDSYIAQRMSGTTDNDAVEESELVRKLSEREFESFLALASGMSVQQVADKMGVAPSTAGTYLYSIKQKLHLKNQAEMALLAIRQGFINL